MSEAVVLPGPTAPGLGMLWIGQSARNAFQHGMAMTPAKKSVQQPGGPGKAPGKYGAPADNEPDDEYQQQYDRNQPEGNFDASIREVPNTMPGSK